MGFSGASNFSLGAVHKLSDVEIYGKSFIKYYVLGGGGRTGLCEKVPFRITHGVRKGREGREMTDEGRGVCTEIVSFYRHILILEPPR